MLHKIWTGCWFWNFFGTLVVGASFTTRTTLSSNRPRALKQMKPTPQTSRRRRKTVRMPDARHFGYVIQNPLPPSLTVDNGGGGKKCAVDATPKTMSAFREANFGTMVWKGDFLRLCLLLLGDYDEVFINVGAVVVCAFNGVFLHVWHFISVTTPMNVMNKKSSSPKIF